MESCKLIKINHADGLWNRGLIMIDYDWFTRILPLNFLFVRCGTVTSSHRHIASHRLGAQSLPCAPRRRSPCERTGPEAQWAMLVARRFGRYVTQIKVHLTYQKPRTFIYHHFSIFAPSQNINLMPSTNTWRQITISANRFWPLAKVRRCRAMEIIGVGDEWEGAPPSQATKKKGKQETSWATLGKTSQNCQRQVTVKRQVRR